MFEEFIRLVRAFNKKRSETSLINAIRISYKYIADIKKLDKSNPINHSLKRNNMNLRPLVSILLVSYNSGKDLKSLIKSINNQTYRNIEIILIENGNENSEIYLNHLDFPYKYISSNNIGFAAGNNLAFNESEGDYICLVNPDTILDKWVIEKLLEAHLVDRNIAISVPKIVFYEKFIDIEINSNYDFSLDLIELNKSLNYKKYFIRVGEKSYKNKCKDIYSKNKCLKISLPVDDSKACLKLNKHESEQGFTLRINESTIKNDELCKKEENKNNLKLTIYCDKKNIWWGKNLINNAGSGLKKNVPFDIGFGEYDFGIQYDKPSYVNAFCGCVAMISPKVFIQRKIFIDEFFAYFEDSELSSWVIRKNLSIKYIPLAMVKHKHSASSEDGSIIRNTLVGRSKNIYQFLTRNSDKKLKRDLINNDYSLVSSTFQNILRNYDQSLLGKTRKSLYKKNKPSIGIYNSYWNTMGGGEKHALSVAKLFSKSHEIYLISERDFDENKLKGYFSINFKFRKFISFEINSEITHMFDIFVNASYNSTLISYCPKSFYLVSFPHEISYKRFINNYFFLHNSNYTKKWALKYWGNHKNSILYPILGIDSFSKEIKNEKHNLRNGKRNFISIGRFTKRGHAKRQDFIMRAFLEAQKKTNSNFNLFLIGSLDISSKDDLSYFKSLKEYEIENIHLFHNLKFSKLLEILSISKIYIHAAGVEINSQKHPENLEHFGISVIEALSFGNYPLVYNKGGPAETIKHLKVGETFDSFESLVDTISRIMNDFSLNKYSIPIDFLEPYLKVNEQTLKLLQDRIQENKS